MFTNVMKNVSLLLLEKTVLVTNCRYLPFKLRLLLNTCISKHCP